MEPLNLVEEWRPVVDFEAQYEISNIGRVRRISGHTAGRIIAISKKAENNSLYPQVNLWKDGRIRRRAVHLLVAAAFLGPTPASTEVNHIDGDKWNPAVTNLEFLTRSENVLHAFDKGLQPSGENHYAAKLSSDDIAEIRRAGYSHRRRDGTVKSLAAHYGVTHSHISYILSGQNRKRG